MILNGNIRLLRAGMASRVTYSLVTVENGFERLLFFHDRRWHWVMTVRNDIKSWIVVCAWLFYRWATVTPMDEYDRLWQLWAIATLMNECLADCVNNRRLCQVTNCKIVCFILLVADDDHCCRSLLFFNRLSTTINSWLQLIVDCDAHVDHGWRKRGLTWLNGRQLPIIEEQIRLQPTLR